MDLKIREAQKKTLNIIRDYSKTFALCGGTALELYYLNHRFSKDLDFFSARYDPKEIGNLADKIGRGLGSPLKLESELALKNRARVRFYAAPIQGASYPLKIDFVQDVIFDKPKIKRFNGVPVYDVGEIYRQKIVAVTGTTLGESEVGREEIRGRNEARDGVDLYYLSKKIRPLRRFVKELPRPQQRGMVIWYRTFSRQDFKLGFLDLELYDKQCDSKEIIRYLEGEIESAVAGSLE